MFPRKSFHLQRVCGRVAYSMGKQRKAIRKFQKAIKLCEARGMDYQRAKSLLDLAAVKEEGRAENRAEAIDKAAMRAKMAGTDAYLEQWRREVVNCGQDLQAAADDAAAQLEKAYDNTRLEALISSGGTDA